MISPLNLFSEFFALQVSGGLHAFNDSHSSDSLSSKNNYTESYQKAALALRKTEERLLLATRIGKIGVWDWDIAENSVYWSDSLYAIHGLKKEEFQYSIEGFMNLVHPEDRNLISTKIRESLEQDVPYEFEFRAIKPDGDIVWVFTSALILRENGVAMRMLGATVDITLRKKIENDLEERVVLRTLQLERQSNRLRNLADQLVTTEQRERKRIAAILHDHLQQILVASQFQVAEILRRLDKDDVTGLRDSVNRIKDFLLEATRSARSLSAELRPPVLYEGDFIDALKWLVGKFGRDHGLDIHLEAEELSAPLAENLKIMLFESVKELVFNIIKHAKTKEAKISVRLHGDKLGVIIEDSGVGFDMDKFDSSTNHDEGGFGLFSIRERLKLWGGQCKIGSQAGKGTKIDLTVPLYNKSPKLPEVPPSQAHVYVEKKDEDENGISILLVDDHKIVREGLANILKEKPIFQIVAEAENGVEACEKAAALQPDVIIMDINMPQMNGIEATRQIKKQFPHICIIGLSVQDENDTSEAMKKAGAVALLNKAGDPENLIKVIMDAHL